jgi:2-polyprenyl-3-methyl-5-hydroxy-6-metoxy-1,4-benzoquinol methylase
MARWLDRWLTTLPPGARILEVGCARSEWLPYFAQRYQLTVTGLDYSEPGCAAEREVLRQAGIDGEVVCADLFAPPAGLSGAFDAVVSFGLVEHFQDTAACLEAIGDFVKPDGMVLTTVPNMTGAVGFLQKVLNPDVYDIHVPLSACDLGRAHRRSGLEVEACEYLLSSNFGVVNLHGLPDTRKTRLSARAHLQLTRLSKLIWALESRWRPLPATRLFAPYAACCAIRSRP